MCYVESGNEEFDENAYQHFSVLRIEASGGGRRSSQLPLDHCIANESALTRVILTYGESCTAI